MLNPHKTHLICWQGWKLVLPRRWDPVKLEGDFSQGLALFADTLRPRLGLRWRTLNRREVKGSDPFTSLARQAMKSEVGQLAAEEAKAIPAAPPWQSPLLYIEPAPPGRDVYCVYSATSNRLLQVIYHAHRREHILASHILPALQDVPLDRAAPWSIFDLNCVIPAEMSLTSHRLNAGDLAFSFADRFNQVSIRQIAVAQLALQRQSLDRWIADQLGAGRYRADGAPVDIKLELPSGDSPAKITVGRLRRRYSLLWHLPRRMFTIGTVDAGRDRLVLLHGSDESLMREIARTVGSLIN